MMVSGFLLHLAVSSLHFSQALLFYFKCHLHDSVGILEKKKKNNKQNKIPLCAILQASLRPRTIRVHLVLTFQRSGLFAFKSCISRHYNCLYFFYHCIIIYLPSPWFLKPSSFLDSLPSPASLPFQIQLITLAGVRGPIIMCSGWVNPLALWFWILTHHSQGPPPSRGSFKGVGLWTHLGFILPNEALQAPIPASLAHLSAGCNHC